MSSTRLSLKPAFSLRLRFVKTHAAVRYRVAKKIITSLSLRFHDFSAKAELRKKQGTVEYSIFNAIKKMIAIRKETSAFADFNNRELLDINNEHLLCFIRFNHQRPSERVLVIANFDDNPQYLDLDVISGRGINPYSHFIDLYNGSKPALYDRRIILQSYQFYWLTEI